MKPIRPKRKTIIQGLVTFNLLISLLFLPSCSPFDTTRIALPAEKPNVMLPGNTSVILNAGSSLRFNSKTFPEKRIVKLDGEGMFYVRRGSTFLCKTEYGIIRTTGNQFNVYARPDKFEVTCYQGTIEIIKDEEIISLQINEKATWNVDHFEKGIDYSEQPGWMNNETVYVNQPFTSVIGELERQYNLKVELDITGDPTYTGSLTHENLQEAMDVLVKPYSYSYEQNGQLMRIWEP